MNNTECTNCPVAAGTHKPAQATHQIDEPQAADSALEDFESLAKERGYTPEHARRLQHARAKRATQAAKQT